MKCEWVFDTPCTTSVLSTSSPLFVPSPPLLPHFSHVYPTNYMKIMHEIVRYWYGNRQNRCIYALIKLETFRVALDWRFVETPVCSRSTLKIRHMVILTAQNTVTIQPQWATLQANNSLFYHLSSKRSIWWVYWRCRYALLPLKSLLLPYSPPPPSHSISHIGHIATREWGFTTREVGGDCCPWGRDCYP